MENTNSEATMEDSVSEEIAMRALRQVAKDSGREWNVAFEHDGHYEEIDAPTEE